VGDALQDSTVVSVVGIHQMAFCPSSPESRSIVVHHWPAPGWWS